MTNELWRSWIGPARARRARSSSVNGGCCETRGGNPPRALSRRNEAALELEPGRQAGRREERKAEFPMVLSASIKFDPFCDSQSNVNVIFLQNMFRLCDETLLIYYLMFYTQSVRLCSMYQYALLENRFKLPFKFKGTNRN